MKKETEWKADIVSRLRLSLQTLKIAYLHTDYTQLSFRLISSKFSSLSWEGTNNRESRWGSENQDKQSIATSRPSHLPRERKLQQEFSDSIREFASERRIKLQLIISRILCGENAAFNSFKFIPLLLVLPKTLTALLPAVWNYVDNLNTLLVTLFSK